MRKLVTLRSLSALSGILLLLGAAAVQAAEGDWIVRLRGIAVIPDDSSGNITLNGAPIAGSGVSVGNDYMPELDITYMFHRNWGVEVILGSTNHDVKLSGDPLGTLGIPGVGNIKIFDTWVLPPTVTLQYHFLPENNIRPYVGMGVNYTIFYGEDATAALEGLAGPTRVTMSPSLGWAAQAGMDIDVQNGWFLNFDVKYIDMSSTAKLTNAVGVWKVDVDIDPWVVGVGIGRRF